MPAPHEITPVQLSRLIGAPDAPALLDVRLAENFDDDPRLLPGASRAAFDAMERQAPGLAGRKVVVVCQRGRKLSQGAAATLRLCGVAAECLEGGHVAWREAGLPLVDTRALPPADAGGRTLWVTRHRPKIDRIACPWLIRRFVDRRARFLFVPPLDVLDVAERFGATPFDVEDVRFSHRGAFCSFDTMIAEFGLAHAPLDRLAAIVRGADTNRHDLAPEAAGLLAVSLGLSRMHRDDLAQLDAGMIIYDALYRWARDATDEGHDWPSASTARTAGAAPTGATRR